MTIGDFIVPSENWGSNSKSIVYGIILYYFPNKSIDEYVVRGLTFDRKVKNFLVYPDEIELSDKISKEDQIRLIEELNKIDGNK